MSPLPGTLPRRFAARSAFTLIELLVSMVVLTLLILMVSQMVGSASRVVTGNREHLETDSQARLVFDRMALDIGRMVKRKDVDYIFPTLVERGSRTQQPDNDKFFFFSEAPAYFGSTVLPAAQSSLALIGYRVNNDKQPDSFKLSRLSKGLAWDESTGATPGSVVFLTYPAASPSPAASPTPFPESTIPGHWAKTVGATPDYNPTDASDDASYHVIGEQVCRMSICYLLKPEKRSDGTVKPAIYSHDPFRAPHTAINGLRDVQAIVVALVILDDASRRIATNLSNITAAFPDITLPSEASYPVPPAAPPKLMAQVWLDKFKDKTSFDKLVADAKIPTVAAAQLRIYQRHFYLDTQ
jgi:prepilin-type N-terminal cleavage/methylation domain-containing protein